MSQTAVCGIPYGTSLADCSKEDLKRLSREVGRNYDPVRLAQLRSGRTIPDPGNGIETQYHALFTELHPEAVRPWVFSLLYCSYGF